MSKFLGLLGNVILAGTLLVLAWYQVGIARADTDSQENAPGSSIVPEGWTQVQMIREKVVIDVYGSGQTQSPEASTSGVIARVTAGFHMDNPSQTTERMQVRFPLMSTSERSGDSLELLKVQDFSVRVDGVPIEWVALQLSDSPGGDVPPGEWAAFDVVFPIDESVAITVSYNIISNGSYPEARFNYLRDSATGWSGTVREGEFILRLPYPTSPENVLMGEFQTSPGAVFEGNEVRWRYDNLEPGEEDNWRGVVLAPDFWREVRDLRHFLEDNRHDARSLLRLADLYRQAALRRSYYQLRQGAESFLMLSEAAYDDALDFEPDSQESNASAEDYASYAEVMYAHLRHADTLAGIEPARPIPTADEILVAINEAITLDPENEAAWLLFKELDAYVGSGLATPAPEEDIPPTGDELAQQPTPTPQIRPVVPTPPMQRPPRLPGFGFSWGLLSVLVLLCGCGLVLGAVIAVVAVIALRR